jgi:hypothetical protein
MINAPLAHTTMSILARVLRLPGPRAQKARGASGGGAGFLVRGSAFMRIERAGLRGRRGRAGFAPFLSGKGVLPKTEVDRSKRSARTAKSGVIRVRETG